MSAQRSCRNLILRNRKQKIILDFITRRIWMGWLKMTDMKMTDHQNCRTWNCRTWICGTSKRNARVSSGDWETAEYSSFSISDDTDKYRLSVSGYNGTARNALMFKIPPSLCSNGMQFSTKDEDNDNKAGGNCAADPTGLNGWWYNDCTLSCLNYDSAAQWYRSKEPVMCKS